MSAEALREAVAAFARADARLAADDLGGAIAEIEAAVARAGAAPHPGLLARLGDLRLRHGRIAAAVEALEAALARDPELVPARVALARARPATGADDANLAAIRALLERPGLSDAARAALDYAAAKLLDDAGDPAAAWRHAVAGRARHGARLRRYDAAADAALRAEALARHAAAQAALPAGASASRLPVVIVGMPRSGTTLVARLIGAHPAAAEVGERRTLHASAKALAAVPPDAPAAAVAEVARAQAARHLAALAQAAGGPRERIATKLPSDYRRLGAFATLFPQAAIVVCRRHPLDAGLSILMQHFAEGDDSTTRETALAAAWAEHRRWLEAWRAALPNPWLEVEYEALVREPAPTARRLIEGLGLEWDPRVLDAAAADSAVRTASAWQVMQPIHARSVGRWQSYSRELEPLRQAFAAAGVEVG